MAKRANPFVEDFVQQSKIHIGIKQFNNNKERLKIVYEKTLELLFKGAKKTLVQDVCSNNDIVTKKKDGMKQLCLCKDGSISHSEVATIPKEVAVQHCNCGNTIVESQCAYCETTLCSSCQHGCLGCQKTYCSHCSLIGSEGLEVCVSCYS